MTNVYYLHTIAKEYHCMLCCCVTLNTGEVLLSKRLLSVTYWPSLSRSGT
jgi:hypothetical protein